MNEERIKSKPISAEVVSGHQLVFWFQFHNHAAAFWNILLTFQVVASIDPVANLKQNQSQKKTRSAVMENKEAAFSTLAA